jgi:F1F0 ATPase subunit 2
MNDVAAFSFVLMAGFLLGALFFGGLWWTVQKGLTSQNPVLWFFTSTLLRTGFAVAGFYFISQGDWRKFVLCLIGFVIARVA